MKLTVEIKMDNAAFEHPGNEVAVLLRKIAAQTEWHETFTPGDGARVLDTNGNTVGYWEVQE